MLIGGRVAAEDRDARALLDARIAAARRQPRWVEIPYDLVARGPFLVSAATDEVFLPRRGVVFERGSARLVAGIAALVFAVTDEGELLFLDRQPDGWSQLIERRARHR